MNDLKLNYNSYKNIHEWALDNEPSDTIIYKDGYWDQIRFIRDRLPELFHDIIYNNEYAINYTKAQKRIVVINTHTSKSIKLPVVLIDLEDTLELKLIMRNNFHDWKISVLSSVFSIEACFGYLFEQNEIIDPIYCEGFKEKFVFDSYQNDKKFFTVEIRNDYQMYTFIFLVINSLKRKFLN